MGFIQMIHNPFQITLYECQNGFLLREGDPYNNKKTIHETWIITDFNSIAPLVKQLFDKHHNQEKHGSLVTNIRAPDSF